MILPDMQPVFGFDAFIGDAGAHHFRQSVDVDRVDAERLLDFRAHGIGPGLGAENADFQRGLARVETLGAEFIQDRQHVGRRHHDDLGLEIGDQLHLPFGHAAGHRDHRAAERLRAVMRAEPAGEQSIAIGDMHLHAGASAGSADRARHQARPGVDVFFGIADDGRLAGCARGRVDARDLVLRHGEHAERIIVAQVVLGRERKLREVFEPLEIGRLDAGGIEFLLVRRHIVIDMLQRPFQPLRLQRRDLVARGGFDRLQAIGLVIAIDHVPPQAFAAAVFTPASNSPSMVREWPRNSAMTFPSSRVTVTS